MCLYEILSGYALDYIHLVVAGSRDYDPGTSQTNSIWLGTCGPIEAPVRAILDLNEAGAASQMVLNMIYDQWRGGAEAIRPVVEVT